MPRPKWTAIADVARHRIDIRHQLTKLLFRRQLQIKTLRIWQKKALRGRQLGISREFVTAVPALTEFQAPARFAFAITIDPAQAIARRDRGKGKVRGFCIGRQRFCIAR